MVMANIYSVHMDKNHWGDPEVFRPERFLNNATGKVVTDSWFIPFGVGQYIRVYLKNYFLVLLIINI